MPDEPAINWRTLSIMCADADRTATFYSQLLGWDIDRRGGIDAETGHSRWVTLRNPANGIRLAFSRTDSYQAPVWPEEPDRQAMMMHMEIAVSDVPAATDRAIAAGGTVAPWQPPDRDPNELRVVLDPSGHPLCLFQG